LQLVLAASPSYLAERGTPVTPSDLAGHAVIIGPAHSSPVFSFRKDGRLASVHVDSQLAVTLNEGAIASALAGLGIAATPPPQAELQSGALVCVLPDWDLGSVEISALFASGKSIKPAARAFAEFFVKEFRTSDPLPDCEG
jgi:DNA-binding transcriptional LysR family regulator